MAQAPPLPINLPTVPNFQDQNNQFVVVDLVEHAVVSDTKAEDARFSSEGFHARRTRVVSEGKQPSIESFLNVLRKCQEGPFGGRLEEEAVAPHLCEPRLPADLLVGHGPGFFPGGQDGGLVEAVLEVFEEFQVFNGHQGGDGLPVTFEDDSLALERHTVQRVGERVPNGGSRNACHGVSVRFVRFVQCRLILPFRQARRDAAVLGTTQSTPGTVSGEVSVRSARRGMSTAVSVESKISRVEVTDEIITAYLVDGRVISVPLA